MCVCSISLLSSPPQAKLAKKGAAAKNPDAKWHAVVQLAVTALDEAGGDLEHIGESSTLQDALLAALKRARLLRQEAPPRHHERPLGCDRPSERQHVELRLPARHQVASLTLAKKRAPPHKVAGTTLLIEPLRPIPPGAVRARAWYEKTYGAVAPEPADYFFGVRLEPHGGVNHGQPTAPHRGRLQPGHVRTINDRPHLHVPQRVAPLHTVAVRNGRIAVRAAAVQA